MENFVYKAILYKIFEDNINGDKIILMREVPCWGQVFYHSFAFGIPDGNSRVATLLERCSKWHDGILEDGTREH